MPIANLRASWVSTEHDKGVQFDNNIKMIHNAGILSQQRFVQRPLSSFEQGVPQSQPYSLDESFPASPTAEQSIATVDEDIAWSKKTILCLDGGGVRGYSSLLILQALLESIKKEEQVLDSHIKSSAYSPLVDGSPDEDDTADSNIVTPSSKWLPCHYFDYIAGTSTGGLIAIMLGRLRMSVDEALHQYQELAANVFEKPSSRIMRSLSSYSRTERWDFLKLRFDSLRPLRPSPHEKDHSFKSDPIRCRTIACSIKSTQNKDFQTPFLFRSYDHDKTVRTFATLLERNPSDSPTFAISDVARATSAAPSFFRSVDLSGARYYDAAVDLNNPSWEVVNEVSLLSGEAQDPIDVLLSIGGGNSRSNKSKKFGPGSAQRDLDEISDYVHRKVESESKSRHFDYFRLDVDEGLQEVRLNEWKPKASGSTTLRRIKEATQSYLRQNSVKVACQQCAQRLVNRRTQRAQTLRWEYFASGTHYKCPEAECPTPNARYPNRNELMDHLRIQHDRPPPDVDHYEEIQALLDRGRTHSE